MNATATNEETSESPKSASKSGSRSAPKCSRASFARRICVDVTGHYLQLAYITQSEGCASGLAGERAGRIDRAAAGLEFERGGCQWVGAWAGNRSRSAGREIRAAGVRAADCEAQVDATASAAIAANVAGAREAE